MSSLFSQIRSIISNLLDSGPILHQSQHNDPALLRASSPGIPIHSFQESESLSSEVEHLPTYQAGAQASTTRNGVPATVLDRIRNGLGTGQDEKARSSSLRLETNGTNKPYSSRKKTQRKSTPRPIQNEKSIGSLPPEILLQIFRYLVILPPSVYFSNCGCANVGSTRPNQNGMRSDFRGGEWKRKRVEKTGKAGKDNDDAEDEIKELLPEGIEPDEIYVVPQPLPPFHPLFVSALSLPFTIHPTRFSFAEPPLFPSAPSQPQHVTPPSDPPLSRPNRRGNPRTYLSSSLESRASLAKLARVCRSFVGPARNVLYEVLVLGLDGVGGVMMGSTMPGEKKGDVERLIKGCLSGEERWTVELGRDGSRTGKVLDEDEDVWDDRNNYLDNDKGLGIHREGLLSLIRVLALDFNGRRRADEAVEAAGELLRTFNNKEGKFGECRLEALIVRGLTPCRMHTLRSSLIPGSLLFHNLNLNSFHSRNHSYLHHSPNSFLSPPLSPVTLSLSSLTLTGADLFLQTLVHILPALENLKSLTLMGFSTTREYDPTNAKQQNCNKNQQQTLRNRTIQKLEARQRQLLPPVRITQGGYTGSRENIQTPIEWDSGLPRYRLESLALYGCIVSCEAMLELVGVDSELEWEQFKEDGDEDEIAILDDFNEVNPIQPSRGNALPLPSSASLALCLKSLSYHPLHSNTPTFGSSLPLSIFLSHPLVARSPLTHVCIGPEPTPKAIYPDIDPDITPMLPFDSEDPLLRLRSLTTLEVYCNTLPPLLPQKACAQMANSITVLDLATRGVRYAEKEIPALTSRLCTLRLIIRRMNEERTDLLRVNDLMQEKEKIKNKTNPSFGMGGQILFGTKREEKQTDKGIDFNLEADEAKIEVIWLHDTHENPAGPPVRVVI